MNFTRTISLLIVTACCFVGSFNAFMSDTQTYELINNDTAGLLLAFIGTFALMFLLFGGSTPEPKEPKVTTDPKMEPKKGEMKPYDNNTSGDQIESLDLLLNR